jgi:AcrR family transcriptional regulator
MARRRAALTRERVLRAAVALADDHGIDAVTMRGLAAGLGVEAMSLYNHVDNKDDLLDGMVEVVAEEIDEPPTGSDWRAALRHRAMAAHQALLRHPWASALWASRMNVGPARMHHMDAFLRDLRSAGFEPGLLDLAFHTLQNHVLGHALQAASFPFDEDELPALGVRYLETFPTDRFPDLAAHIRFHIDEASAEGSSFAFGLDLLLDGLAAQAPPAR